MFSAWNSVGTHKVRLGTPTHALPHGTPAFKTTFYKMLEYMLFVTLQLYIIIHDVKSTKTPSCNRLLYLKVENKTHRDVLHVSTVD